MIHATYRGPRTRVLGGRKFIGTAVVIGAIAYFGSKAGIDGKVNELIYGNLLPEDGYHAAKIETRNSERGKLEYFLKYSKDGKEHQIPIMKGTIGPQVGSVEYVLSNTDYGALNREQKLQVAKKGWEQLDPVQKLELVASSLR